MHLPDVLLAYEGTGVYGEEHRLLLMSFLEEPEKRKHPWPAELDRAFGIETPAADDNDPAVGGAGAAAAMAGAAGTDDKPTNGEEKEGTDGGTVGSQAGKGRRDYDSHSKGEPAGGGATMGEESGMATATGVDRSANDDAGGGATDGGGKGKGGRGAKGGRRGGGSSSAGKKRSYSSLAAAAGFGKGGAGAGGGGAAGGEMVLLGSPMVDATLEDTQGLQAVIEVLKEEMGIIAPKGEGREGDGGAGEDGSRVVVKMQVGRGVFFWCGAGEERKGAEGAEGTVGGVEQETVGGSYAPFMLCLCDGAFVELYTRVQSLVVAYSACLVMFWSSLGLAQLSSVLICCPVNIVAWPPGRVLLWMDWV